jgi:integrase/recombinase XerD
MKTKHIQAYISYLRIEKGLCEHTVTIYHRDILEFGEYIKPLSIRKVTRSHIRDYLFFLTEKENKAITRRRKLTALRNFFLFLKNESLIPSNPAESILMPKVHSKEPTCLSEKELRLFLKSITDDISRFHTRNELMARMFIETGIRLSELVHLSVGDIDTDKLNMRVNRKGGREQSIPLNKSLAQRIKTFVFKKARDAPLFTSSYGRRITQRRVGILMKIYFQKAGLEKDNLSCHNLRHSYCSRLLEKGVNIRAIQILAGHKNIATTEMYLHIAENRLRKDAERARIRD